MSQEERDRIRSILEHAEGQKRPQLSRSLAYHSSITAEEAVQVLKDAPIETRVLWATNESSPSDSSASQETKDVAKEISQRRNAFSLLEALDRVFLLYYFTFSGRAPRSEYWWSFAVILGLSIAARSFDVRTQVPADRMGASILLLVVSLVPSVAVSVRRLHDVGFSGWWIVLPWVLAGLAIVDTPDPNLNRGPFLEILLFAVSGSILFLLVLYLLPSESGPNRYGPNPLEVTP